MAQCGVCLSLGAFWVSFDHCLAVSQVGFKDWAGDDSVFALVVVHQLVEFLKIVIVKHINRQSCAIVKPCSAS